MNAIGTILAQAKNPLESLIRNTNPTLERPERGPDSGLRLHHPPLHDGECGPVIHPEFGSPRVTRSFAPGVLSGWNNRRANWQHSVGIQHELTEGLSIEVAYFRRENMNFLVADNLNIGPEHFTEFSIIAPTDPVLGSYSGQTLGGPVHHQPGRGRPGHQQPDGSASEFGDMWETFNGIDFIFDGRLPNGITLAGGIATGASEVYECFVVDNPMQARDGYCNYAPAWSDRTQYKLNGSVPLPYDMAFSFVFQSIPGERRFSNYRSPASSISSSSSSVTTVLEPGFNVPLFPGGIGFYSDARGGTLTTSRYVDNSVQWEPQVNQLDLRLTKILRFGGGLIRANFDVFNILNAGAVTRVLDTYTTPAHTRA